MNHKKLLGWMVNSARSLISLPPKQHAKISALLNQFPCLAQQCTLLAWQVLCGNLRSIAPMLPVGLGLFSCLYTPPKGSRNWIRHTADIHHELADWRLLLDSPVQSPTHIREILPDFLTWTGAHDASGQGKGGVFAGPNGMPYLWRHQWSSSKAVRLVSFSNPGRDTSINDLELAGNIAQLWLTLPKMARLAMLNGSDNSTSIWWVRNGRTSTLPIACSLLWLCSWLLREYEAAAPMTFLAGKDNHQANAASRRWDLSDSQLCSLFDHIFLQATSLQMLHLTPKQEQGLSMAFARMRLPLASI
jgi:hypothetical protein